MAELNSRDRLQPSLLDRLIDVDPQAAQESVEGRILSRAQLRAAVLRDLTWLFNTTRPEPEVASERKAELALWASHPEARHSVLNFGMPAFAGITLSSLDRLAMERAVLESIRCFEPRIDADTLDVEISINPYAHHNTVQLKIRGQLWAQPVPLELMLAAEVDVETGFTRVRDLRA